MSDKLLKIEKSAIEQCNSIIIKDPYYDRDVWCAFQNDNCSDFTHAKGLISNYDAHYKDDEMEFDMNTIAFGFVIGTNLFMNHYDVRREDDGSLVGYMSKFIQDMTTIEQTEIGCDTAQFSFGNEKTFGEFSIHTGADGGIGQVNLFINKQTGKPVGLLFIGECDGDIVPPQEIYYSFIAAFGMCRIKENYLNNKIERARSNQTNNKKIANKEDLEK